MEKALDFGTKKQLFTDGYIIEPSKTTAEFVLQKPVKREEVLAFDEAWEGDACGYMTIIEEENFYRLYYLARDMRRPAKGAEKASIVPGYLCYAESKDGLNWTKPSTGICEYDGIKENNILIDDNIDLIDNFFVFKDANPKTPDSERYKGVAASYLGAETAADVKLWCYTSPDGIHFKKGFVMVEDGAFDSLNTIVYNEEQDLYFCYFRGMHDADGSEFTEESFKAAVEAGTMVRDVRVMTSKDFRSWSKIERLRYSGELDYQMYTNGIFPYGQGSDLLIGLASRYVEKKKPGESSKDLQWTQSHDELPSPAKRWKVGYGIPGEDWHAREALALTDCVFMSSHDGFNWTRYDEAFLTPGPEKRDQWFYGNCYPALGFIKTPSADRGAADELSFYSSDYYRTFRPVRLFRYTIRMDGMVALKAGAPEKQIVTKPFVLAGSELYVNFATSAYGGVYVRVLDADCNPLDGYESCEHFGDSVNRRIGFQKPLKALEGQIVRLEFKLSDAAIYAFTAK